MTALLKIFGIPGTIALASAVVLALLLGACTVGIVTTRASLKSAKADVTVAQNQRDAAQHTAGVNAAAADGWQKIADTRAVMLKVCQIENTRLATDNVAAVARAQARALDAERTLTQFTARYAASIRLPECAAARARLDAACPVLDF